MTVETKKCSNNVNFQLLFFIFLILISEVLLIYTTFTLTKSNYTNSCSENEIWDVINSEKFSAIIKEKVQESLREVRKKGIFRMLKFLNLADLNKQLSVYRLNQNFP